MTRIFEFIVAAIIVVVLAVVVGVLLPAHGHIERSVDVSHNVRHIYDVLSNFRRFNEWGALRALDPKVQYAVQGPAFGEGAKLAWRSADAKMGDGSYTIGTGEQDAKVVWNIDSPWKGENKAFRITLEPQKNPKIIKIRWAYDVDYGWDLIARYSGLYLHGDPATQIQVNLQNLQSLLATIPNIDYANVEIFVADVAARPELVVSTQAPRSLDEVALATEAAVKEIDEVLKKQNLQKAGPLTTMTTEWGDENYVFDVVVPLNGTTLQLDGQEYTIGPATPPTLAEQAAEDTAAAPVELAPGQIDKKGNLVVAGNVRARTGYVGKVLFTTWVGSPAGLPLMRLALKSYAQTHGFHFNEVTGRFYDEMLTDPTQVADDEQQFVVYLPVSDTLAATGTPPQVPLEQAAATPQ